MPISPTGQIIDQQGNPTGGQVNLNTGQMTSPNIISPVTGYTITANDLNSSSTLNYKTPQIPPPETIGGLNSQTPTVSTIPIPSLEQKAQDLTTQIQNIQNSLIGKGTFERGLQQQLGIPEKNQAILDYQTRLDELKKKEAVIQTQYGGSLAANQGVLEPFVTGEKDARLRQNAIEALTVSANIDAMKGLITSAQSKVDLAIQQKYGPDEERLKVAQENLNTLVKSGSLTREQERLAEQQSLILRQKEIEIVQARQNATDIWNTSINAAANINNFKPTAEYATAAEAIKAIQNSKTKEIALQIAINTGLTKQPIGQSDFEQAFLREKGRLPTVQELLDYKKQQFEVKSQQSETRDATTSQYLQSQKGTDGFISAQSYQEGLKRFIANGGNQTNFIASFPQQTYLRQEEINKLPTGLRSIQVTPRKELTAEQQGMINEAKATWDAAKQTFRATPELRIKIIERAKNLGFDISPYF